ncbi:MAG: PAS domain S-box protein [Nitrospinae bacterium]|nr:PAS domain S-box protein [Nitrospinota bacterium]
MSQESAEKTLHSRSPAGPEKDEDSPPLDRAERRELEERFQAIISSANDAIIMLAGDGRVTVWNRAAERMFGYSEAEMLGATLCEHIIPEQYRHRHKEGMRRFGETGRTTNAGRTLELTALRKGGGEFHIELSFASPIHHQDQWHAVAFIRDITERKVIEEALQQTLAERQAILESAGVGISLTKRDTVIWWNRAFAEMLDLSPARTDPLPLESVFTSPAAFDLGRKEVYERMARGEAVTVEGPIRRKGGGQAWIRRVLKAVDPHDMGRGYITIGEDFTERKEMEVDLRVAKERAEEATQLKDRFVSLVAHDLKAPFNAILGFMKVIVCDDRDPLTGAQKDLMNRAIRSGENLVRMIDTLLDLGRLQTGQLHLEPSFVNGATLAAHAVSGLDYLAREKGIVLVNKVPPTLRLHADFNLLTQVIVNLVANAIKFCREGDVITLFAPPGERGVIGVRDTGVGIDPAILCDLFRHDVKTSRTGTAGEGGTGLGLPFCHDIMKAHGGELTVENAIGEGAVFFVRLPPTRPRALLVDDGEIDRLLCRTLLEPLDLEIHEAADGEEGVRMAHEIFPHLIVSDVEMPRMNGFELLERLTLDPATAAIPVIVVTSRRDAATRAKAFQCGARDFVPKPLDRGDFLDRVRRFVG